MRTAARVLLLLLLPLVPRPATAATSPLVVETMDDPKVVMEPGSVPIEAAPARDPAAPSKSCSILRVAAMDDGAEARVWLAAVDRGSIQAFDGVNLWLRGSGTPTHVQVLLRPVGSDDLTAREVFVSRVLLTNPLWHRVFLPFSEFYDPATRGTYPVRRFPRQGEGRVELGLSIEGPLQAPIGFAVDELGLATWDEVNRTLAWPSYMPPSHGFPPYVDRFEGPLVWGGSNGGSVAAIELDDFPYEGFTRGLRATLPTRRAAVSRSLDLEPLPYYEGLGLWLRGDGTPHEVELVLIRAGKEFTFGVPVLGRDWKLVFAGFENFRHGPAPFEVDEPGSVSLALRLRDAAGGGVLEVGPLRLGYEK